MRWIKAMAALLVLASRLAAEDWPQLMGNNRDNTTSEIIPVWKDPPRILWRKAIGEGKTPPIIAGGKLYVQEKVKDSQAERLLCLDAATGKELWSNSYPRATFESNHGNGPRGAPAVAAGRVFTHGITGILTCYDAATGKKLWQRDTHKDFNVGVLRYGVFCSPLVVGNRVVINVGGKAGSLVGFDTETGKTAWKALDDGLATSAPCLYQAQDDNLPHVVFMTDRRLVGIDPLDGGILWQHPLAAEPFGSGPPPVWLDDLLFANARAFGGIAVRVRREPKGYRAQEVWKNQALGSYYPMTAPLDEKYFWTVTNGSDQGAPIRCIERQTGKELWKSDSFAEWHVGVIRTGDRKMLVYDGKGVLHLMANSDKGPVELAQAKIGLQETINHALADGRFYARDHAEIVCVELARPGAGR
jgi:outer membrane protein assembly factor BamB